MMMVVVIMMMMMMMMMMRRRRRKRRRRRRRRRRKMWRRRRRTSGWGCITTFEGSPVIPPKVALHTIKRDSPSFRVVPSCDWVMSTSEFITGIDRESPRYSLHLL
jgi:hypothetical protein